MTDAARLHSPAAERNRDPLLAVLRRLLPPSGVALEIAAGSGQHAAYFAEHLPEWVWWPTDGDMRAVPSVDAWCAGLPNVRPAQSLDVCSPVWAGVPDAVDLVFCANLIHISPWACCEALMQGAARQLRLGGLLVTYGPYWVADEAPAPSNQAFDADLRRRDPSWGVRRLEDVAAAARAAGLVLAGVESMPANNKALWFQADMAADAKA